MTIGWHRISTGFRMLRMRGFVFGTRLSRSVGALPVILQAHLDTATKHLRRASAFSGSYRFAAHFKQEITIATLPVGDQGDIAMILYSPRMWLSQSRTSRSYKLGRHRKDCPHTTATGSCFVERGLERLRPDGRMGPSPRAPAPSTPASGSGASGCGDRPAPGDGRPRVGLPDPGRSDSKTGQGPSGGNRGAQATKRQRLAGVRVSMLRPRVR
jgi:hypothetical protein